MKNRTYSKSIKGYAVKNPDYVFNQIDEYHKQRETIKLSVMKSSPTWAIVMQLVKARRAIIPPNSMRYRVYTRLKKWLTPRASYSKNVAQHEEKSKLVSEFLQIPALNPFYQKHIDLTEPTIEELRQQSTTSKSWVHKPKISLVTPVYNTKLWMLDELVHSVRIQTYPHHEWILIDASDGNTVFNHLEKITVDLPNIKLLQTENLGISGNTNIGLRQATGDFIGALDHDDILASNALFEIAKHINQNPESDLIFSDMDKINLSGQRVKPFFKMGWSRETLLCANIVTHFTCYRRQLLNTVGYLNSEFDVAQDWDLYLRISAISNNIHHIPKVLYHWRMSDTSTSGGDHVKATQKPQIATIEQYLRSRNISNPRVYFNKHDLIRSKHPIVEWSVPETDRVSVIVIINDNIKEYQLRDYLNDLQSKALYSNLEIIVIHKNKDIKNLIHPLLGKLVYVDIKASLYQIYNVALQHTTGKFLIFLNYNLQFNDERFIQKLLQWFELDNKIVAVSPRILNKNGSIHYSGVHLSLLPIYHYKGTYANFVNIAGSDAWYQNHSGFSIECFAICADALDNRILFDRRFTTQYAEFALSMRLIHDDYRIVYTPDLTMTMKNIPNDYLHNSADLTLYLDYLNYYLPTSDPYVNPNLWLQNGEIDYSFGCKFQFKETYQNPYTES